MKFRSLISGRRFVVVLAMAGIVACHSPEETASAGGDNFSALQSQYFTAVDFRGNPERIKTFPDYAAKLGAVADAEKLKFDRGELAADKVAPKVRERAGLIFIYDALLIHTHTMAVTDRRMGLKDLSARRSFTRTSNNEQAELAARADYVVTTLVTAAQLRPNDRRIDSWLAAARANVEFVKTGAVSEKSLVNALDVIPVRPTFNLWTALLMFRDHDESEALVDRLSIEAKRFVDAISSGNDPCKQFPQDCQNGQLAPYNNQGAMSSLGDLFLRRSEMFLQRGDIPQAMQMAGYAQGTYAQLDRPENQAATKAWPDFAALAMRKTRIAQIQKRQKPEGNFKKLESYLPVYECASCHGRFPEAK